jgi:hypothetical protein
MEAIESLVWQFCVCTLDAIKRWPDWEVDSDNAQTTHTASVRGWATLPVAVL